MSQNLLLVGLLLFSASFVLASSAEDSEHLRQIQNIQSSMNTSVDPCDDFYGYACGNYYIFQNTSEYADILTTVQGEFLKEVQQILKTNYPDVQSLRRHSQSYTEKLQIYLHSCLEEGGADLLEYLAVFKPQTGVEWPILEEVHAHRHYKTRRHPWSAPKYDVFSFVGQLFSYGLNDELIQKQLTTENETLALNVPELQDLDDDDVRHVLSLFDLPEDIIHQYYEEIMGTHSEWQLIYMQYNENEDGEAYDRSFEQLQQHSPEMSKFIRGMFLPNHVPNQQKFIIIQPKYFDFLLQRPWKPKEAEKLCNYLMVRFLIEVKDTIDSDHCLKNTNRRMSLAVNYVYNKHKYQQSAALKNERLSDMIKNLYKHFLTLVKENRLRLNDHQMVEIMTKLNQMVSNVGNLPKNVNESMVEDFYRSMGDMDLSSYYKNELNLRQQTMWETCHCPPHMMCDNIVAGSLVNMVEANVVILPFASLTSPMYHTGYDPLMSLSLLGFIMGHEFGHAIDPNSLNSELYFTSFRPNSTEHESIRNAVKCMQQQEPATDFIGERVSDSVGLQVAFRAYSHEYGNQPGYTTIPWQQLFFLNMAQFFCSNNDAVFSSHDADNVRLRHIAMNSEEFSHAFQCPRGSRMNPERKCRYV